MLQFYTLSVNELRYHSSKILNANTILQLVLVTHEMATIITMHF